MRVCVCACVCVQVKYHLGWLELELDHPDIVDIDITVARLCHPLCQCTHCQLYQQVLHTTVLHATLSSSVSMCPLPALSAGFSCYCSSRYSVILYVNVPTASSISRFFMLLFFTLLCHPLCQCTHCQLYQQVLYATVLHTTLSSSVSMYPLPALSAGSSC